MSWKYSLKALIGKSRTDKSTDKSTDKTSKQTLPKKSHTDNRLVKSDGIKTQFEGVTSENPHKQLIIGLDFGTAFTKVVVGEDRIKFAVPLNGAGNRIQDYLLPSIFWSKSDGYCSLIKKTDVQHADLKLGLLKKKRTNREIILATVFLSMVLRRIREYVFNNKKDIYSANYIDWLVNIGLPTSSYHSNRLTNIYKKIIKHAWIVSAIPEDISITNVTSLFNSSVNSGGKQHSTLHHEAISVFPEFVAQVTGYVRSPLRQSDLHLLVDVGAGTLDSTVFNVHEQDDEDRFPIFAKSVVPRGTRFLVKHRLHGSQFNETGEFAPFVPVPTKKRFSELLGVTDRKLELIDKPFRATTIKVVADLLKYTKTRRYPRSSHWKTGIPMFLCGGGANNDFYRESFLGQGRVAGFPVLEKKLSKPESLVAKGVSGKNYDRLSVAYGLSFDPFDIGEIIREDKIEDVSEGQKDSLHVPKKTVSDDITCPKCRGTGGLHMPCDRCGGSGFA